MEQDYSARLLLSSPSKPKSSPTLQPRTPPRSASKAIEGSPSRKLVSDRFISRSSQDLFSAAFHSPSPHKHESSIIQQENNSSSSPAVQSSPRSPYPFHPDNNIENTFSLDDALPDTYSQLLRSEVLGIPFSSSSSSSPASPLSLHATPPYALSPSTVHALASMSPSMSSSSIPSSPARRKVSPTPSKILDAPGIVDDYYLNLCDWSSSNILAIALADSVYLWNGFTGKVSKLYTLDAEGTAPVTSLSWSKNNPSVLAVGTNDGQLQMYDVQKEAMIRSMAGHTARVGCLAWNHNCLSSGGRDRRILHRDTRSSSEHFEQFIGHKQEVCGLRWSPDGSQLASGGNDNKLMIWTDKSTSPLYKYSEHQAAVKALAWSPHVHGLLASGGGTADRTIRFWNTITNTPLNSIDTGSQVCNLAWSENVNEIVSTHGFSQNQICVWKYPTMQPVATLIGHVSRVLYLAVSPDGQTIVTGAGDETLRFWNVFPPKSEKRSTPSLLKLADIR